MTTIHGHSLMDWVPSALRSRASDLLHGATTVGKAAKRVAALALVDVGLAVPQVRPACDAALNSLSVRPSNGESFMPYRPSKNPSALLVLCHPSAGPSMCRSIAEIWQQSLQNEGIDVHIMEIEGGDKLGLQDAAELKASLKGQQSKGAYLPPKIQEMQELVEMCQFLIFIHPIFWFDVPSQLKGFMESVFSSGFAFHKLPSHWVLDRAAGIVEHVPVARKLMRRYAAYGLLRDKTVYITRTQGGPSAGMGIYGHGATSLESSLQFCGAHLAAVDAVSALDSKSEDELSEILLPELHQKIRKHCKAISLSAKASRLNSALPLKIENA